MRLREIVWKRGLVAALTVLAGCMSGPDRVEPVEVDLSWPADRLLEVLEVIAKRPDFEASIARARIYDRLRRMGEGEAVDFLTRGDAADLDLIAQAAFVEYRAESIGRLAMHFEERAKDPALRRHAMGGPLAGPLQDFILLSIACRYAEYGDAETRSALFQRLALAAQAVAGAESLDPDAAPYWSDFAAEYAQRAAAAQDAPTGEARKFCEISLDRHLEEAVRAADLATIEKVARGDRKRILGWYLESLAHFLLARECITEPTPAQQGALEAQDMVVRGLYEVIVRKEE